MFQMLFCTCHQIIQPSYLTFLHLVIDDGSGAISNVRQSECQSASVLPSKPKWNSSSEVVQSIQASRCSCERFIQPK